MVYIHSRTSSDDYCRDEVRDEVSKHTLFLKIVTLRSSVFVVQLTDMTSSSRNRLIC